MIYKYIKLFILTALIFMLITTPIFLISCNSNNKIKLYDINTKTIKNIDIEEYIQGVVSAEISGNAPLEALKAQAILARTYTYDFIKNNKSKYESADISNDITEAQAYNNKNINENIKKAVKSTKNKVIKYNNKLIKAYFHSNSGGQTVLTDEGFNLDKNYPYLKSVKTKETIDNTNNYQWSYTFTKYEILSTLKNMNISLATISSFNKGKLGKSGRCLTFNIGGQEISATEFRLNIGTTKMKSTFINKITVEPSTITISGYGYGHGVGLSQEYSCVLAKEGKNYKDIINYFYKDINIINI